MSRKIPSLVYHVSTKSHFNKFDNVKPYVSEKETIHTITPRKEAIRIANKFYSSENEVLLLTIRTNKLSNKIEKAEGNCWHIIDSIARETFDVEVLKKNGTSRFA